MSYLIVLHLFLSVSPTITGSGPDGSAEEVTVTLSNPTSLVCEVQSYPPALIIWLKDGTPFESNHHVRVLPGLRSHVHLIRVKANRIKLYGASFVIRYPYFTGGRTLQILNAKEEDAGRYTCVATNEAGETVKHYEVKVYGENPASFLPAAS